MICSKRKTALLTKKTKRKEICQGFLSSALYFITKWNSSTESKDQHGTHDKRIIENLIVVIYIASGQRQSWSLLAGFEGFKKVDEKLEVVSEAGEL